MFLSWLQVMPDFQQDTKYVWKMKRTKIKGVKRNQISKNKMNFTPSPKFHLRQPSSKNVSFKKINKN